jgi:hypothetical protein
VPEDKKATLIPAGWFEMWADATFATDPAGGGKTLRAPNGVVQDGFDYWGASPPKAIYDPAEITAPVLLVLGKWDHDTPPYMAQALFPLLTNAAWRRHVVLSEGTILLEKNRVLLPGGAGAGTHRDTIARRSIGAMLQLLSTRGHAGFSSGCTANATSSSWTIDPVCARIEQSRKCQAVRRGRRTRASNQGREAGGTAFLGTGRESRPF